MWFPSQPLPRKLCDSQALVCMVPMLNHPPQSPWQPVKAGCKNKRSKGNKNTGVLVRTKESHVIGTRIRSLYLHPEEELLDHWTTPPKMPYELNSTRKFHKILEVIRRRAASRTATPGPHGRTELVAERRPGRRHGTPARRAPWHAGEGPELTCQGLLGPSVRVRRMGAAAKARRRTSQKSMATVAVRPSMPTQPQNRGGPTTASQGRRLVEQPAPTAPEKAYMARGR